MWERFWEAVELQRLLVDTRSVWEARFTHPLTNALTVPELLSYPGLAQRVVWTSGDATPDKIAAVEWNSRVAVAKEAGPLMGKMLAFCAAAYERGLEARFGPEIELMISLAELLAVLALVCQRWREWGGMVVLYAGDNKNVVDWLRARQAGPAAARFLLQVLAAVETTGNFRFHSEYVRTYHNKAADQLTREDVDSTLQRYGLERLPFSEALLETLDRGWAKRAFLWDGMDHGDRSAALQLHQRRHPAIPGREPSPLALGLEIGEVVTGPPQYWELCSRGLDARRLERGRGQWDGEAEHPGQFKPACVMLNIGRGAVAEV